MNNHSMLYVNPNICWLIEVKNINLIKFDSFFVSVKFCDDYKTVTKFRLIWPPSVLGVLPNSKQWSLSVHHISKNCGGDKQRQELNLNTNPLLKNSDQLVGLPQI